MSSAQLRRILFYLSALLMLLLGVGLVGQALLGADQGWDVAPLRTYLPKSGLFSTSNRLVANEQPSLTPTIALTPTDTVVPGVVPSKIDAADTAKATLPLTLSAAQPTPTATRVPTPTPLPIQLAVDPSLPVPLVAALAQLSSTGATLVTQTAALLTPTVRLDWDALDGAGFYTQTFAAATRFDVIDPSLDWQSLRMLWQGEPLTYTAIAILTDTVPALTQTLGPPGALVEAHATFTDLLASVWDDHTTLALVPFDQLVPRLGVLAIDGQNPVENAAHFDPARYPLTATVYLHENNNAASAPELRRAHALVDQLPHTNRQPAHLTVVAMTGVTAMARMMGAQMDKLGADWPSEVVGSELASADLTIISNEVAFAPDCKTMADPDVLLFCSKPEYWTTLEKSGVDLISLTGNHVNDWGRQSLSWTLEFYAKQGMTVYGGGSNAQEAVEPRIVTHNGNRLAFLGSNSVGPYMAWASDSLPGAARFDFGQAAQLIAQARHEEKADVIFYDLQYLESYNPWPLIDQRNTFNLLLRDGADVVTGVQSHVPQSFEFTDGRLILFGLGNLYFDQMWGEATRQSLIVKHTIYEGRHISSQLLVTVLYDYGQPHWATPEERADILQRLFAASYW